MAKRIGIVVIAIFLAMIGGANAAAVYDRLVVFGDSLSDSGNVYHLTSTNPAYHPDPPPVVGSPPFQAYYMGRESNGPNWVDQLADRLHLPRATATLEGGSNYAYGSARSGFGTNERFPSYTYPPNPSLTVLPTGTQIDAFAAREGHFKPTDLVTLWVGANDFRDILLNLVTVPDVVNNIIQHVRKLNGLGARTIVVPNQVDLSQPPYFRATPYAALVHTLTLQFDADLAAQLNVLAADPTISARIVPVDEYSAMAKVFADPGAYGFSNITDPALTFDTGTSTFSEVPDVSDYFWYDVIHPTTRGQAIFAEAALAALVPEPSPLALLAPGLALIWICSKRGHRITARALRKADATTP